MKYTHITTDWQTSDSTARVLSRHESAPESQGAMVLRLVANPSGSPREPVVGERLAVWVDVSTPYALYPTTAPTLAGVYDRMSRGGRFPADRR